MIRSKSNKLDSERQEIFVKLVPVVPRDFIVLAVPVIVTLLSASDLVAAQQHGYAL